MLAVALARPQVAVSVTVDQARIVLVTDQSGSMAATDVLPTRLDAARKAASSFLDRVPERVQVGAITFNQTARVIASPTRDRADGARRPGEDHAGRLDRHGRRAGAGDQGGAAGRAARAASRRRRPSSCSRTASRCAATSQPLDAAREAAKAKIPIYTISLGTAQGTIPRKGGGTVPVPPDPETLKRIAEISKGRRSRSPTRAGSSTVYEKLGKQLTRKKEHRQITAGFAGGGLALLVLGAGMSLFLFGRVP